MDGHTVIFGYIAVYAALTAGVRPVYKLLIDTERYNRAMRDRYHSREKRRYDSLKKLTQNIDWLTPEEFSALPGSAGAGGMAAEVGERHFLSPEALLNKKNAYIVLLDGIEDPYNFGYVLRTLYVSGVDGVLLPERNFFSASDTVIRSSAGASEFLDIAVSQDLASVVILAKKAGFRIISTAASSSSVSLREADISRPLCLLIGGEKRGISKKLMALSDTVIRIDYPRACPMSLSASAAANILAYEVGSAALPPDDTGRLSDYNRLSHAEH